MMDSHRRDVPGRKPYNQALSKDLGERQSSWANMTVRPCKPDDRNFNKRNPKAIEKARQTINDILKKYNLAEMRVASSEGRFSRHASDVEAEEDEPKPKRDVMEAGGVFHPDVVWIQSMPGQSLALKKNASSSGTFGGFFEITLPGIAKPKVIGITCFHVINPTEKEKKGSNSGYRDWGTLLQRKTKRFGEVCVNNGHDITNITRKLTQRHVNCRVLERVGLIKAIIRKGRGTAQDASIDNGTNLLPTNYDWALVEVPPEQTHEGHALKQPPLPDKLDGLTLCISGQRSGYSEGSYNPLNEAYVDHEIIDGKVVCLATVEHGVAPRGNNPYFAKSGDSGALVYTKDAHVVVGLCFGGCPRFPFISYFTHNSDLIADIKQTTGATRVSLLQD
ncbi:hypothetical protein N7530_003182 [Penicillium desertorum]|uniref:Peptidase S1 domain-containing protein n=1 Tax=Penicillium desertorum TaxID=1303715 RepID=A0A9W9WVV3_9EURO|nr:hypothetical protein N7530_003182 [Penicillium desertorum]